MLNKRAIITGISGQDGAYLAQLLLKKGYTILGLLRDFKTSSLEGLEYLKIKNDIQFLECDLEDREAVEKIVKNFNPTEIYNLAAQSSVYLSFKNPIETFKFNTSSVFNLLEAIKNTNLSVRFYQASSSEMYGRVNNLPISESSILHPLSPYAISKSAAHFTCIHYRESYKMHVCSGILFNHESYLRKSTFFVKKIIQESIKIKNGLQDYLYVGNIDVYRDFGYAPKYVEAIFLMLQLDEPSDFLICSGQSVSLRELIYYLFEKLNISIDKCKISEDLYRPADIENMYGNNAKAKKLLNWDYDLSPFQMIDLLLEEELSNYTNSK